jgi:hypothetical protein
VDHAFTFDPSMPDAHERRAELVRESSVMVLYLSAVLLAALATLPADYGAMREEAGGPSVLTIVWGTTVGLALAHWFAFRVATSALAGGRPSRHDISLGAAQLLGAALIAAVSTIVIVLVPAGVDVAAARFVPAAFIGVAGYGLARGGGHSAMRSTLVGALVLAAGLGVAGVKAAFDAH